MTDPKAALRREVGERLAALDPVVRERAERAAEARAWELPPLSGASSLLLFASRRGEVPTDGIAAEARRRGLRVAYPRCHPVECTMDLWWVASPDDLRSGRFGIREPGEGCPPAPIEELDVALIPGVAWDRAGGRLGRGLGFYDRLLAAREWRAFRCGLLLAVQEVPRVPRDPWDEPLDWVVTDREVWRSGPVSRERPPRR